METTKTAQRKARKVARVKARQVVNQLDRADRKARKIASSRQAVGSPIILSAPTRTSKIVVPVKRRNQDSPINTFNHKEKRQGALSHRIHVKAARNAKRWAKRGTFTVGRCGDPGYLERQGMAIWSPNGRGFETMHIGALPPQAVGHHQATPGACREIKFNGGGSAPAMNTHRIPGFSHDPRVKVEPAARIVHEKGKTIKVQGIGYEPTETELRMGG